MQSRNVDELWPIDSTDYFVAGDLVIFTGYMYTPDYVYVEQYNRDKHTLGVGLSTVDNFYEHVLYRVYWFDTARVTEVVAGHMRLAYEKK